MKLGKRTRALMLSTVACLGLVVPMTMAAPAQAACGNGTWVVGVGGLATSLNQGTWQTSAYIGADERVEYDSANANMGLDRLRYIMSVHRAVCPGDHLKMIGHSEGAAIVHQWVIENTNFPNANAILLADPKMHEWPGGDGFARELWWYGYPMAGNDDWFGNFPTRTICSWWDHICRADSDWVGYFTGAHTNYNMNGFAYGNWEDGSFYF